MVMVNAKSLLVLRREGYLRFIKGFCAIREDGASISEHYPCKNIPDIVSFSPYDCFSLNLGHILFNGSGLYMRTYTHHGESNVT